MTLTATPPQAVADPASSATPEADRGWLATVDHKKIGLLYLGTGLALLVLGLLLGAADAFDLGGDLQQRIFNARTTTLGVLSIGPAWLGLATYLVPLQIGSSRLALPRLQAASYWAYLGGSLCVLLSFLIGPAGRGGLGLATPLQPIIGREAATATQLWITGLAVVAGALVAGSIGIIITVLTRRAPGMTMLRMPGFTWGSLTTAGVTLLSTPVFLAGLAMLWMDQRFGGTFFAGATRGTRETWMHTLWLYGRPEIWLLVLPALGAFSDVVATHARRPLLNHAAAMSLVGATGALTLTAWAADKVAARSVLLPNHSPGTLLIVAPFGLLLLLWLGTLKKGDVRFHPSMAALGAFLALLGLAAANALVSTTQDVGRTEGFAFSLGQVDAVIYGPAILGLVAALAHWAPKLKGRAAGGAAAGGAGLVFLGTVIAAASRWIAGYTDSTAVAKGAGLGYLLIAAGVLGLLALVVGAGRSGVETDDPYDAGTLEWATSSPPPPHNFDTVPEVRSATPLADLRTATTTGGSR